MAVEGTLDLFKLPEILQLISQQQKTGILTVQGQQDIVAISFLKGRIVAADALNQTVEQGLADVLVHEGLLSAQEFARASSEHQASGARLLDVLVERRYVERPELLQALRLQTYRLLQQLLRWSEGDFKFYSGDEVSYEEGFDPIAVEDLLINSLQEIQSPLAAVPVPAPRSVPPLAAVPSPSAIRPVPAPEDLSAPARPALRPVPSVPAAAPAPIPVPAAPAPVARPVAVARPAAAVAGVAVPPDPEAAGGLFRRMKVETPAGVQVPQGGTGKVLGAILAALLIALLWVSQVSMFLPFPWQDGDRTALVRDQREALYLKIDRAAKTHFLLEGSFPDRLSDLVEMGLLSEKDLQDPLGLRLEYTAGEESYTIVPLDQDKPVPEAGVTEAITGNFLLDPEFLSVSPASTGAPLVLLD